MLIWTKTIDLFCSDNRFYPFEDCSIFQERPYIVSCGKRDPNKAFVPGLMYFFWKKMGTKKIKRNFAL
jgi:hypothetical protein